MPETLYLIDAYAQIFRAYYAIRGGMRSNVTGEPTHAVFGFAGMLFRLFTERNPDYVAVAFETMGNTFRDELYDAYKATRSAIPDDLTSQVPRVLELIECFGIPLISKTGLEADDVIATITHRILADAAFDDVHIRLISKDKDLEQLLHERVCLFDIHTDVTIDCAALLANKGITPAQVIDYLALMGDSVDNVPGVEGIGPKTAAQLIQQFGSIDGIYANLDQIVGKRRENLERARGHLPLSRELVTLKCDDDFEFSLESARIGPFDVNRAMHLFQQLGFGRYQDEFRRLAESSSSSSSVVRSLPTSEGKKAEDEHEDEDEDDPLRERGTYRAVRTKEELAAAVAAIRAAPMLSVDTETTGLNRDARICGFCLAWEAGQGVYVPTLSPETDTHLATSEALAILRPALEDESVPKTGHNLKFDALTLLREGVQLRGVGFDTMLACQLLDPGQGAAKLDTVALKLLGYRMTPIIDLLNSEKEGRISDSPVELITNYAAERADIALRLTQKLLPEIESAGMTQLICDVEAPLSVVLAEMETTGVQCDPDELTRQGDALKARVEDLRRQIFELCGYEFHLDSTQQIAEALFDRLGLKAGRRTKTGRSTDIEVLEKLAAQEEPDDLRTTVPRLLIEYRQLAKLISTYMGNLRDSIRADGRIHSTFHQLMTATGRLASHGPNLQNIPVRTDVGRQIRKAFKAPPGHLLICADYSQIELRFLAHFSEDPALIRAFEQEEDIHAAVASQVFEVAINEVTRDQRNSAKTINFGIIYGVSPSGLSRRIEGMNTSAAAKLIGDYKARYTGIDAFLRRCVQQAMDQGYVTTILGRRRAIPEVFSTNTHQRSLGERLAINSVIQGSAADLIKLAMVNVQRRIDRDRLPMKLLLQIHDELVLETPEEHAASHAQIVRQEMERAMILRVPLVAEAGVGPDWMTAK